MHRYSTFLTLSLLFFLSCKHPSLEHLEQGDAAFRDGKFKEADGFLNAAIEANPHTPEAYFLLMQTKMELKDYPATIDAGNTCLDFRYQPQRVHEVLAIGYNQLGDRERAFEHIEKTLNFDSRNAKKLVVAANYAFALKDWNKALSYFQLAEKLGAKGDGLYHQKGACSHQLKNWSQALVSFQKVKEGYAQMNDVFILMADCYLELKNLKKANDFLLKVQEFGNQSKEAMQLSLRIHTKQKEYKKAIEIAENYNAKFELDAEVLSIQAHLYATVNELGKAEKALKKLNAVQGANFEILRSIAQVRFKQKKYSKETLDYYDRALALKQNQAVLLRERGVVKKELDQMESACEDWNTAAQNGDSFSQNLIASYCLSN